jgi:hypothetical protein
MSQKFSGPLSIVAAAAVAAAGLMSGAGSAQAAPGYPLALKGATSADVQTVQWRGHGGRGGWRGGGWRGPGIVGGLAAGGLIGGALAAASSPYYGSGYYAPGYYAPPAYAYGGEVYEDGPVGGDAQAYCMQRFRSYDPASGTYLGYDGLRHPCP